MIIPSQIIAAAQQSMRHWSVPASVSIAQWALESAWGVHAPGNNPFGIKALPGRPSQTFATHECVHGHMVACTQTFAQFETIGEAFDVHARLLASAPVYAGAMQALPSVPKFVAAMAVHYATDPLYAGKIMSIIRAHSLTQYDGGSAR